MKIIQRMKQPTPLLFRKIRNLGLALVSVSGAVMAAPVAPPAIIETIAGYLAVAGTVAAAISQAVTEPCNTSEDKEEQ